MLIFVVFCLMVKLCVSEEIQSERQWDNSPTKNQPQPKKWIVNDTSKYGYILHVGMPPSNMKWREPTKVSKYDLDFLLCGNDSNKSEIFDLEDFFANSTAKLIIIIIQSPDSKIVPKIEANSDIVIKIVDWSNRIEKLLPSVHQKMAVISVDRDYVVRMSTTSNVKDVEKLIIQHVVQSQPQEIHLERLMLQNRVGTAIVIIEETESSLGTDVQTALNDGPKIIAIHATREDVNLFVPQLPETKLPALYAKSRNRWIKTLKPTDNTKDAFVQAVKEYMETQDRKFDVANNGVFIMQKPGSSLGREIQKNFENDTRVTITYDVYQGADKDFYQVERIPEVYGINRDFTVEDLAPPVDQWKYQETIYHWKGKREIEDAIHDYLNRHRVSVANLLTADDDEYFILLEPPHSTLRQQVENCLVNHCKLRITNDSSIISDGSPALYAVNSDGAIEKLEPKQNNKEEYVNAIEDYWFRQNPRVISFDECFKNGFNVVVINEPACSSLGTNVFEHFDQKQPVYFGGFGQMKNTLCIFYGLQIENYVPVLLPHSPKPAAYGINDNYDVEVLTTGEVTMEGLVDAIEDYYDRQAKVNKIDVNNIFDNDNARVAIVIIERPGSSLGLQIQAGFEGNADVTIRRTTTDNKALLCQLPLSRIPAVYAIDRKYNIVTLEPKVADVQGIKQTVSDYLLGRKSKHFDMDHLFTNAKVEFVIIIVQKLGSLLGEEIEAEFEHNPKVLINYVDSDDEPIISKLPSVDEVPAIYGVDRENKIDKLKGFQDAIKTYLDKRKPTHIDLNQLLLRDGVIVVILIIESNGAMGPKIDKYFQYDSRLIIMYGSPENFNLPGLALGEEAKVYGKTATGIELIIAGESEENVIYAVKQFMERNKPKDITFDNSAPSAIVIVQEPGSSLGREIEKNFENDTRVVIKYTDSDYNIEFPVSIDHLPEVYGIRGNLVDHLEPYEKNKKCIEDAIFDYLAAQLLYDISISDGIMMGSSEGIIEKNIEAILDLESTYLNYMSNIENDLRDGKSVFIITQEHQPEIQNVSLYRVSSAVSFPLPLPRFEIPSVYAIDQHYNVDKLSPNNTNLEGLIKEYLQQIKPELDLQQIFDNHEMVLIDYPGSSLLKYIEHQPGLHFINTNNKFVLSQFPVSQIPVIYDGFSSNVAYGKQDVKNYILGMKPYDWYEFFDRTSALVVLIIHQLPDSMVGAKIANHFKGDHRVNVVFADADVERVKSYLPPAELTAIYSINRDFEIDVDKYTDDVINIIEKRLNIEEEMELFTKTLFIGVDADIALILPWCQESNTTDSKFIIKCGQDLEYAPLLFKKDEVYVIDKNLRIERLKLDKNEDAINHLKHREYLIEQMFDNTAAVIAVVIVEEPGSFLGQDTETFFADNPNVVIEHMDTNDSAVSKIFNSPLPHVYVIDKDHHIEKLKPTKLNDAINECLQLKNEKYLLIEKLFEDTDADHVVVIVDEPGSLSQQMEAVFADVFIKHMETNDTDVAKIFNSHAPHIYIVDKDHHIETLKPSTDAINDYLQKKKEKYRLIEKLFEGTDADLAVVVVHKPGSSLGQEMETVVEVAVEFMDTNDGAVSIIFNSLEPHMYVIDKDYHIERLNPTTELKDAISDCVRKKKEVDLFIEELFVDTDAELAVVVVDKPSSFLSQHMETLFADNPYVVIDHMDTNDRDANKIFHSHAPRVYVIDRDHHIETLEPSTGEPQKVKDAINDCLQKKAEKNLLIDGLFVGTDANIAVVIVEKSGSFLGQQMESIFADNPYVVIVHMDINDILVSKIFNNRAPHVYIIDKDHHIEKLQTCNSQKVKDAINDYLQKKEEKNILIEELLVTNADLVVVVVEEPSSSLGQQMETIFAGHLEVVIKHMDTNDTAVSKIFNSPAPYVYSIGKDHRIEKLIHSTHDAQTVERRINDCLQRHTHRALLIEKLFWGTDANLAIVVVEKPGAFLAQQIKTVFGNSDVVIKSMDTSDRAVSEIFNSPTPHVYVIDKNHHIETFKPYGGNPLKVPDAISDRSWKKKEKDLLIEELFVDTDADLAFVVVEKPNSSLSQQMEAVFADLVIRHMDTNDRTVCKIFNSPTPQVYVIDRDHNIDKLLKTSTDNPQKLTDAINDRLRKKQEKVRFIEELFNGTDANTAVVLVWNQIDLFHDVKEMLADNPDVVISYINKYDTVNLMKIFSDTVTQQAYVIDKNHHFKALKTSDYDPNTIKKAILQYITNDKLMEKHIKTILDNKTDIIAFMIVQNIGSSLGRNVKEYFEDIPEVFIEIIDITTDELFNSFTQGLYVIDQSHHITKLKLKHHNRRQIKKAINDYLTKQGEIILYKDSFSSIIYFVDKPGSSLCQEIHRDFNKVGIDVVMCAENKTLLYKLQKNAPVVYGIDGNHHIEKLKYKKENKQGIKHAINDYLKKQKSNKIDIEHKSSEDKKNEYMPSEEMIELEKKWKKIGKNGEKTIISSDEMKNEYMPGKIL